MVCGNLIKLTNLYVVLRLFGARNRVLRPFRLDVETHLAADRELQRRIGLLYWIEQQTKTFSGFHSGVAQGIGEVRS